MAPRGPRRVEGAGGVGGGGCCCWCGGGWWGGWRGGDRRRRVRRAVDHGDAPATHPMIGRDFAQRRQFGGAGRLGDRAAPGKAAALGRIDRAGGVGREPDGVGGGAGGGRGRGAARRRAPLTVGTADISATLYGRSGRAKKLRRGARSTMCPRYITAMASQICSTTAMSCELNG